MSAETILAARLKPWPQEFESFRAEQRQMVDAWVAAMPVQAKPTDPAEKVKLARAGMAAFETNSSMAQPREIAGVPCRVFVPDGTARGVYLDIHGGGLVVGSAKNNDAANEALSQELRVAVVSIDYRLAPEHPYPAGPDDCFAVARWLLEEGAAELGSDRLVVGGESAGAYLAATTLLRARDLGMARRFAAANLVFGIYDIGGTPSQLGMRPSRIFDVLDPVELEFVRDSYTPGLTTAERRDPGISPLYGDLNEMPPALFTVGTADHVLDDSLFMSARWAAAGNVAELAVYPDCGHGFVFFPTELGRRSQARIANFIKDSFAGGT